MSTQKITGYIIALIASLVALLAFFAMPYVLFASGVQIVSLVIQALQISSDYSSSFSPGNNQATWLLLIVLLPIVAAITALIAVVQLSRGGRAGRVGATWLIVLSALILVGLLGIYIYFAANNGSFALGTGFWVNLLAMVAVLIGGILALKTASPVVSQPWSQLPSWTSSQQQWPPAQPTPQTQPWQQPQQSWQQPPVQGQPGQQSQQQWPPAQRPPSSPQWPPSQSPQSSPQWPPEQQQQPPTQQQQPPSWQ